MGQTNKKTFIPYWDERYCPWCHPA